MSRTHKNLGAATAVAAAIALTAGCGGSGFDEGGESGVASLVSGGLGSGNQYPLTLAAGLLMTIPVALVFFFFQRYFVRGAGEGAVKG